MFTRAQLKALGKILLKSRPNSIVRLRILRDVLHLKPGDAELENARDQVLSHPWVKELEKDQQPDGSWGRFHSMDSTKKARFPTTEIAVRRGLALGLDIHTPVMERAAEFMERVLAGKAAWSDREEKAEGWSIAVEAITAATLAEIDPDHPAILPAWQYWSGIASRSFHYGTYVPSVEWNAHKDSRGLGIRYLGSRYVLTLLGARSTHLPASIEHQIVAWVANNPAGIGYLGADLQHPDPFHIFHWLESLEILSRYPSWRAGAGAALTWLWARRNQDGLWDFGTKVSKSPYFPLADDWRQAGNRCVDHSTRVLACISTYDPGF